MAGDGVVRHISAAVAAGEGDGFSCGSVFVAEHAGGCHVHHVVQHQACFHHSAHRHIGRCGVVIGFVSRGDTADGQRLGRDVGAAGGLPRDVVVVHIRTCIAAGEGDSFGRAHVLVSKHARGRRCHHIATDETGQQHIAGVDASHHTAVIHPVVGHKARHGQCFFRDGGRGGGLVSNCVVGQVGAVVAAGQVDRAGGAGIFGGKHTGGRHMQVVAHHLAVEHDVGGADGGAGGGVVHLVVSGNARHGHGFGVDLGAGRGVADDGIVARFAA